LGKSRSNDLEGRARPFCGFQGRLVLPEFVAHADWGTDPRKRQVALAELLPDGSYLIANLGQANQLGISSGDLRTALSAGKSTSGRLLAGFDFPIGLPLPYAALVGVTTFPDFLNEIGKKPFHEFARAAATRSEITPYRPFYPQRPGGTRREHLYVGLGLQSAEIRRLCEGNDAETVFWTLGGKQVGKAALAGWQLFAASVEEIRFWPFNGSLDALLSEPNALVVAETYPREFYRYIKSAAPLSAPWSKTRQIDRLLWIPRLLEWAEGLGIRWAPDVLGRVRSGLSPNRNGEDEFDAVVGIVGMIAVLRGTIATGEPDNVAVTTVEGWILGREAATLAA
jgi:hypothetical protein